MEDFLKIKIWNSSKDCIYHTCTPILIEYCIKRVQHSIARMTYARLVTSEEKNTRISLTTCEITKLRGEVINTYKNLNNTEFFTRRDILNLRGH